MMSVLHALEMDVLMSEYNDNNNVNIPQSASIHDYSLSLSLSLSLSPSLSLSASLHSADLHVHPDGPFIPPSTPLAASFDPHSLVL